MKNVYQFLSNYGLDSRNTAKERIFGLSEKRLEKFADEYTELAQNAPLAAKRLAGATDIYPDSHSSSISTDIIKRLSLCANRIYVHDEVLALALTWPEIDSVHQIAQVHEHEDRVTIFREELADKIDFLLEIEPVVTSGIVHLLPTEGIYPRRDPNGLYPQDFYGVDGPALSTDSTVPHPLLTRETYAYLEQQVKVQMPAPPNELFTSWEELTTCPNIIKIALGDEGVLKEFRFFDVKVAKDSDTTGRMNIFHAESPFGQDIDPRTFRNWVRGSAREVMMERVKRLHNDLILATQVKARFLTDLPISRDLLQADFQGNQGIRGILNMDLPFFDGVDLKDIAKARKNELAFEEFRLAMEKAVNAIPAEAETQEFQKQLDELSRDLLRIPLLKIQREQQSLQRNILTHSTIGIGALGLYFVNPAFALPAALYSIGKLLAEISEKNNPSQDKIKDMPGYFYWSATRGKTRSDK